MIFTNEPFLFSFQNVFSLLVKSVHLKSLSEGFRIMLRVKKVNYNPNPLFMKWLHQFRVSKIILLIPPIRLNHSSSYILIYSISPSSCPSQLRFTADIYFISLSLSEPKLLEFIFYFTFTPCLA